MWEWAFQRGLTPRAMALGVIMGVLMCFSNMYFGLQTGWVTMASIQSAVIGYGLWKGVLRVAAAAWPRLQRRTSGASQAPALRPLTVDENVMLQTVAVAAATMPLAAGFVGIVPALRVVRAMGTVADDADTRVLEGASNQILWCLAICFIGVFVAVPLRHRAIVVDQLKFPSGFATAAAIAALHGIPHRMGAQQSADQLPAETGNFPKGNDAPDTTLSEVTALIPGNSEVEASHEPPLEVEEGEAVSLLGVVAIWFLASATFVLISYFVPVIANIPLFTMFGLPGATGWGWLLSLSPSYIGQGMIMGSHTCASMLLGAIVGWGIIGPVAQQLEWAPGPPMSWPTGGKTFILWISLSIMVSEAVSGLALVTAPFCVRAYQRCIRRGSAGPRVPASTVQLSFQSGATHAAETVGRAWWLSGLLVSAAVALAILLPQMHLTFAEALVALVISLPIAAVAVRALGETDMNPVSGLGKIAQACFAVVSPGNVVGNILAGAVAEGSAQQAGDLMQDLKTGALLGSSPKAQFVAQLVGSFVSVFAAIAAFAVYDQAFSIPSKTLPAPTANIWVAMATLMNGAELPSQVIPFCVLAAVWGISATALEFWGIRARAPGTRLASLLKYMPSPTACAIGMYITPNWTIPRCVGALVSWAWCRLYPASHAHRMVMVATGLVLGEGLTALLTAILASSGVSPATCSGCAPGMCGNGCS